MIKLDGGPADGAYAVGRAPLWLRAVVSPSGKTDVLDQLEDEPKPRESISVYRRTTIADQVGFVRFCGRGRGRGFASVSAEYEHLPEVDGGAFRETEAWQTWVLEQHQMAEYST